MGSPKLSGFSWLVLFLFLCSLFDFTSARPSPQPKSGSFRKARQGAGLHRRLDKREDVNASCAAPIGQKMAAPKKNVFAGLTDVEAAGVASFLFAQDPLNLTTTENAGSWDNTIILIELMPPNKTDALAYLDGKAKAPARYAHVLLDHRASTEPYYQDIIVGPLPVKNGTTTYASLEYPYTRKTSGKIRNLDADGDDALYSDWLYVVSASILDITLDWFEGSALGLDNDTLDIWGIDPLWQDDGIIRWDQFWNYPTSEYDVETLLPTGLYFTSNVTGRDVSKWTLDGWYYNGVFYNTTDDFRTAYFSKNFVKLAPNVDGTWGHTGQEGTVPPLDTVAPPNAVAPMGSRYFVDAPQKYIKWMDFEFYLSFTRDTGMHLNDIKYKGQRIIYELGLQEALAHYAGSDPVQSGTAYLDSYYGFGPYSFELVKGYDCPPYATYLDSAFYTGETTHTHVDSICLFEAEASTALRRHSTSKYVAASKNIFFTVRNVCTVGNYDYTFSYEFHMDGSIQVEVRASGYIQSAYFAKNGDYGYHIQDSLSGSMHDHVLNYKVDFDILGTKNTMTTTKLVPVSESYPWSNGKKRNTMKLEKSQIKSENSSKLLWGDNSATQFQVVNLDAKNKFGEARGYRILPSQGTIHLTVQNSSNLENAANWATHDLSVTRHKDTEPRSSHPYNSQDVANPPIDFNKFFDGESLVQEDLVVWVNLGMHHVPHTGDLPTTVMTTAHSGIQLMPLNYLLGDASSETVNQVQLNYGDGNLSIVESYGQGSPTCMVSMADLQPDLQEYKGDVVIRKFPYDPNDPYYETDSIV